MPFSDMPFFGNFSSDYRRRLRRRKHISEAVTLGDIILVYAAFRRCIHHFSVMREAQNSCEGYENVFKHIKDFLVEKQEELFKEQNYLENDEMESFLNENHNLEEMTRRLVSITTLFDFIDSEKHAIDKHDPSEFCSTLIFKPESYNFTRVGEHYNLEECMQWIPPLMKETILVIPKSERVTWCVSLLLTYHYETECSIFISCALKFCLRELDFNNNLRGSEPYRVGQILVQYVQVIRDFECDIQVVVNCLRVICFKEDVWYFFLKQPSYLKTVLEKLQTAEVALRSVSDVFGKQSYFLQKWIDKCFLRQSNSFTILLRFGGTNSYYFATHQKIKERIHNSPNSGIRRNFSARSSGEISEYRCLQILYLLYLTPQLSQSEKEKMLHAIWASISEPFLTTMDFVKSRFHVLHWGRDSYAVIRTLAPANIWYDRVVTRGEKETRSPRRLQHLSRCAIRGSLQFPISVNSLPLPQSLKDYLMLKE